MPVQFGDRPPWLTDEQFRAGLAKQYPNAGVPTGPPVPMARPVAPGIQPGMLGGGMGGPQPPPSPLAAQPPPMPQEAPPTFQPPPPGAMDQQVLSTLPKLDAGLPPQVDAADTAHAGRVLDDLTSVNMDTQAEKGLVDQLEQARALRDTALPEGRQAGRTFVAANPLEFLGAGIKQYRGARDAKKAEGELAKTRSEIGRKEGGYTKEVVKDKGYAGLFRRKKDDDKD